MGNSVLRLLYFTGIILAAGMPVFYRKNTGFFPDSVLQKATSAKAIKQSAITSSSEHPNGYEVAARATTQAYWVMELV